MSGHDIIVIGGSAGSLEPLRTLLESLPRSLPAAVFVVLHMPASRDTSFPAILRQHTPLGVRLAEDGAEIVPGQVLIATPDQHLVVHQGHVRLSRGPRENYWRPSIDVLFRTAAVAYGTRVVGVLLSGALDDGTAGLAAIRRCGGKAYAQAPHEAAFPDMPENARNHVDGVRSGTARELAAEIIRLAQEAPPEPVQIPPDLRLEARVAEDLSPQVAESVYRNGEPSSATCPECNGPLSTPKDEPVRFRCKVGHALGAKSLLHATRQQIEVSLWSAVRLLQQRATLDRNCARREHDKGRVHGAQHYDDRAAESEGHANLLRELLLSLGEPEH
jgi:two-component system, chemotaxis family, protein-glutamate methylesterase/glutaminase